MANKNESASLTERDIAVPERLYTRFREPLGVFATTSGVVLARDTFDRTVEPATVARAANIVKSEYSVFGQSSHAIKFIAESETPWPLVVLNTSAIHGHTLNDAMPRDTDDPWTETPPHAELGCYIPPHYMMEKFSIPVGACGITGQLLPGSQATGPSRFAECKHSAVGSEVERGTLDATLLDHITEIENLINNPTELERPLDAVRLSGPESYDTDAPVTDEQKAKGITAWRRLENPADSTQAIMLPIYDTEKMPYASEADREAEAKKVPRAGDEGMPENYIDYDGILYPLAVTMVGLRDSPSLQGQAGTGKSAAYRHLAYLMSLPYTRISITPSTEVDELAGHMEYSPETGTSFRYGRLASAWTKPGVICLDEPNSAKPDVWFLLRPLLDSEKQLAIDINEGEILPRHESSYLGMAMNPSWDYRNAGTNPLADADVSRLYHVQVGMPPENVEADIIRTHCAAIGFNIDDRRLRQMRKIATDLRDTAEGGELMFSWGTRSQLKVARLLPYFTVEQAYQAALGASLEPSQEDLFMGIVRGQL